MNTFSNLKELIRKLNFEQELLSDMFQKRKQLSYKYDLALEAVNGSDDRIESLIKYSIIRKNGNTLEIDDLFLQFFEQVLGVNEEINPSYINENIQSVRENINYYLNEENENRRYNYLRLIKSVLRKIGISTLRNVVDLKRNIETAFKNEPNYKIKKSKLENLDKKRLDISSLITQTEQLVTGEEATFFKSVMDEELKNIITQLRLQLSKCTHNLIEIEKQVIDFLNQIKYQSSIVEKLRQVKYLKEQFTLRPNSNIDALLSKKDHLIFESNPSYPLKLSVDYLQENNEAYELIKKVAAKMKAGVKLTQPIADSISDEYLDTQTEEEIMINLDEVKNGFLASSNNLFDFVMGYQFNKEVSFEEKLTFYCQLISQYDSLFTITDDVQVSQDIEFAMVYPK
jgi:hypothetical protein